ncbi:MAG: hypothetical protein VX475_23170 [Myxococcota bacterium]|jgi:hypothetical protein|nr:hypothetical protein [Myxococcota bacterium]
MSDELTTEEAEIEFVEIYATHNFLEAQILEDLFTDQGIQTLARKIEVAPMPTNVGSFGEHRLGVPEEKVVAAVKLIEQAIADGAVTRGEGELLV